MRSLECILQSKSSGDGWSRIDPESVPASAIREDEPLTRFEEVWYSLWISPLYWLTSGVNPSRSAWGSLERIFWFSLGLPPKGLLDSRQFALYLALGLGLTGTVTVAVLALLEPIVAAFMAILVISWALILYSVYLPGKKSTGQ